MTKDVAKRRAYLKAWHAENGQRMRMNFSTKVRSAVLGYYGKNGVPQCTWPGCIEKDMDVLSLDHVHDNGKQERTQPYAQTTLQLYRHLQRHNYPEGYQTMCLNHQMKKDILRRRRSAELNRLFACFAREIKNG
jgi:hypothetical protein